MFLEYTTAIGAYLAFKKFLSKKVPSISTQKIEGPTIEQGDSVPVLFGTRLLKNPVIIWHGDEYLYSYDGVTYVNLGVHFVLSRGDCQWLYRVEVGEEILDSDIKPFDGTSPTYSKQSLFGGWQEEGGISGSFDMLSSFEISPNTYLQSVLGSNIPYFRGVSSVVLKKMYLGTSLQVKPWAFKVVRHKYAFGGIWDYLKIANPTLYPLISAGLSGNQAGADYASAIETRVYSGLTYKYVVITKRIDATNKAWSPDGGTTWTNAFTLRDLGSTWEETFWPETYATADEAQNALLDQIGTMVEVSVSDPSQGFAIYLKDTDGNIAENTGSFQFSVNQIPYMDLNPACILWETFTDPEWGLSLVSSVDIDPVSFITAAQTLYNERFGLSFVWESETSVWDFVDLILKHIDGVLYFDRTDGLLKIKLIRADYDINDLLVFDETNSNNLSISRESYEDLVNSVTVKYHDNFADEDTSVTVQNSAIILNQGIEIGKTFELMGISNADRAAKVALRELGVLSQAFWKGGIEVGSIANSLNIGDVIRISNNQYGLDNEVFRITGINLGDSLKRTIRLDIVQDVFSSPDVSLIGENDESWTPIDNQAFDAEAINVFESPYWLWVQREGALTVNDYLTSDDTQGIVLASAGRPSSSSLYARLAMGQASYIEYDNLDFNPWTELDGSISETDSSFSFTGGFDTDLVSVGDFVLVDSEIMEVSSVGVTIGVNRGILDTLPTSHSSGAQVLFMQTNVTNGTRYFDGGADVNVKLLTTTLSDALTQAEAFTSTVVMDSRAIRPYPPGKFLVNTTPFGTTIGSGDDLTLSWAHRNRENLTIIDQDAASVTTESGVTYTLRIYDEFDVLARTETGLTSDTYTYTQATELSDTGRVNTSLRVELESVRSTFTSSQMYNHIVTRV